MTEEWRKVDGFPDYSVSNHGKVRNDVTGHNFIPNIIKAGYHQIGLTRDRKRRMFLVHRLVALAFLDNPLDKNEVNHVDGDKNNNRADNLEWCTRIENMQHANRTGLRSGINLRGANNGNAKLTDDQRDLIVDDKRLLSEIADQYKVTKQAIWYVKRDWKREENRHEPN